MATTVQYNGGDLKVRLTSLFIGDMPVVREERATKTQLVDHYRLGPEALLALRLPYTVRRKWMVRTWPDLAAMKQGVKELKELVSSTAYRGYSPQGARARNARGHFLADQHA